MCNKTYLENPYMVTTACGVKYFKSAKRRKDKVMGILKYNKGSVFDVKLDGLDTVKLAELPLETAIKVHAIMFTSKGEYGKSAFLVIEENPWTEKMCCVYLPKHKVKECEEIVADAEVVQDIKDGKVGFTVETYEYKQGATRYTIKWCEL